MRGITIALLILSGCGDDTVAIPDAPMNIDAPRTDAPAVDAPVADAPGSDGTMADAFVSQIQAVRDAADAAPGGGNVTLPVDDVLVTYLKPAGGGDPAGFFVQLEQTGPGLFVAVDPTTLSPAPAVGDRVSFVVTMVARVTGMREATAITGFARGSTGNSVAGLVTDVSAAADLVSGLDHYDSRLIHVSGTVTAAFSAAGAGYTGAQFDSAAVSGNTSLRVRMPSAIQNAADVTQACMITISATPLWRFNAIAEPSAWQMSDLSVTSCPAPRVTAAVALDATTVRVSFDRLIAPASLVADGSQFTFDNGLLATAATVNARDVSVTTGAQTGGTNYTVTVAGSITDTRGTALSSANNSAVFSGYVTVAVLQLSELNPNIPGPLDLIELRVLSAGTTANITIQEAIASPVTVATLPTLAVAQDDLIVVHLNAAAGVTNETASKVDCADAACYAAAWDLRGTGTVGLTNSNRVIVVRAPGGAIQDAVPFVKTNIATPPAAFPGDLQSIQGQGLWLPADCTGLPCTYTSTPTAQAVSADWTAVGNSATGNSIQRHAATHMASDWSVAVPSWGLPNP